MKGKFGQKVKKIYAQNHSKGLQHPKNHDKYNCFFRSNDESLSRSKRQNLPLCGSTKKGGSGGSSLLNLRSGAEEVPG